MKLTKYAQAVKVLLEEELAKTGASILELEEALANINHGEGVYKVAMFGEKLLGQAAGTVASIPETAMKASLAGGALTGLTFDEMDSSIEEVNKALEREREKINLVKRITANLQREHGL